MPERRGRASHVLALAAGALLAASPPALAQLQASEPAVEAAYLQKFAGFVDWPPGSFRTDSSPLVMGVLGAEGVLAELVQLARDRLVQKRPIEVRRIDGLPLPQDLNLLFIGTAGGPERARLVDEARRRHVLVVTADPAGLPPGSALNFVNIDRRLRFEASNPESEREGLRLSSRLLGVAVKVEERAP